MNLTDYERISAIRLYNILELQVGEMNDRVKEPVAMHILAQASESWAEAVIALVDVPPEDTEGIRHYQNEAKRFRSIVGWLNVAVATGAEALNELTNQERDALAELIRSDTVAVTAGADDD